MQLKVVRMNGNQRKPYGMAIGVMVSIKKFIVIYLNRSLNRLSVPSAVHGAAPWDSNPTLIYIYAVLLGIGSGALVTALPTFVGTYYSRERYAQVLGVLYPFQLVSLAIAAAVSGAIYDATATYTPAFAIATAFGVAGFVCALLARRPGLPRTNG